MTISKKHLEISGIVLIAAYFIFDGLQKIIDNHRESGTVGN